MLTIHVWPKRLKEFLLTHPLYKSPQRRMWMNPREVLPYPIGDSPADSNPYYRMKYTDPGALWVSTGP